MLFNFKDVLSKQTKESEYYGYFVDYECLKKCIHEFVRHDTSISTPEYLITLRQKVEEFSQLLDFNINRAVTRYEEKFEESVIKLRNIRRKWAYLSPEILPSIYEELKNVAKSLRNSLQFVEITVETVQKLLRKAEITVQLSLPKKSTKQAEKLLPLEIAKLVNKDDFIKSRLRPDYEASNRLYALRVYMGVDRIVEELRQRCDFIRLTEADWFQKERIDAEYVRRVHKRRDTLKILVDLHSAVQLTVKKTKWFYGTAARAKVDYELEPIGTSSTLGLLLNNYNTFLYIFNCYSIIPTANQFTQILGLPSMASGLLLAMTSVSSLLASILYSRWTNQSFKRPLLFSTLLLILGNVLYAMAYDFKSFLLLYIGRLCVGLGGNRALNRRYITDFVPVSSRTFHSAVFVTSSSLGMSIGPGSQFFFNMANFQLPYFGYTVNQLTSPAWISAVLWFLFAIKVLIFFQEPYRRKEVLTSKENEYGLLRPLLTRTEDCFALETSKSTFKNEKTQQLMLLKQPSQTALPTASSLVSELNGLVTCLWIYFVLKLILEAFQTFAPIFTEAMFQWENQTVGYFVACIGLITLPINLIIGSSTKFALDRTLIIISLIIVWIGTSLTMSWRTPITVYRYIIGGFLLITSSQCLEFATLSLISKIMPKSMSYGLWNSSFLSTEAGALGRVVGASMITLIGTVSEYLGSLSVEEMQVLIVSCCLGLILLSSLFLFWSWQELSPRFERMLANVSNDADAILASKTWKNLPELCPICVQIQALQTTVLPDQNDQQITSKTKSLVRRLSVPFYATA